MSRRKLNREWEDMYKVKLKKGIGRRAFRKQWIDLNLDFLSVKKDEANLAYNRYVLAKNNVFANERILKEIIKEQFRVIYEELVSKKKSEVKENE